MEGNEFIEEQTGYKPATTFWDDFSIAEMFGLNAVIDTFNVAFKEWHNNLKYLTELVLVLNHKIWFHNEQDVKLAKLYDKLWTTADRYAESIFRMRNWIIITECWINKSHYGKSRLL